MQDTQDPSSLTRDQTRTTGPPGKSTVIVLRLEFNPFPLSQQLNKISLAIFNKCQVQNFSLSTPID